MLEALQLITTGLCLTILLGHIKKRQRAPLFYWAMLLLLGVSLLYASSIIGYIVVTLPFCLRTKLDFLYNGMQAIPKNWMVYCLALPGLILVFSFLHLSHFILIAVLLIEVMMTYRHYQLLNQKKGITLVSNAGKHAWWTFGFTHMNLLLVLSMAAMHWIEPFQSLAHYSIVGIGFLGMITFLREDPWSSLFESSKYEKSSIEAAEKYRLSLAIDEVFREGSFYRSFDASLNKLSREVKGTTHHVSQVINESKGMTFVELLSYHRVREAKKIFSRKENDHLSVEGVAAEVGYASKAAFNKAFKKFTGKSPSEFRQVGLPDQEVPPTPIEKRSKSESTRTFEVIKNSRIMLSNFLKIYFRNQMKNKPLSLINLLGLTFGITSTILIAIYLNFETSYDTFHSEQGEVYRIAWESDNPQTRTPHPMAQALVNDFPQVRSAVSLSPVYGPGLTLQSIYLRNPDNNQMFQEPDIFFADSTFFDVFNFPLLRGERKSVLDGPGEIVISSSLATKYFGEEDPVGKRIEFVEYDFVTEVTGVMEDPPANGHFHPQVLISYMSRKYTNPQDPWLTWEDFGHFNYVKLDPGSDPLLIENDLTDWVTRYREFSDFQIAQMREKRAYFRMQPITEIHLHSDLRWELESNGNIIYVYILVAAIIFLIVISIINYVNLSTARALERTKEVGIRRSLGAGKKGISVQFILEAVTTCLFALIFSYLLSISLFSQFSELVGKQLDQAILFDPMVILGSLLLSILIGMMAGIYPSIYISKLKPLEILKGKIQRSNGIGLRKTLLGIQFIVAGIMIFGSVTIYKQIQYIQNKELGFENDQLLVLELHTNQERQRIDALKNELNKIDGVIGSGGISNLPGSQFNQNSVFLSNQPEISASFSELGTDYEALQLLGLQLNAGRWFEPSDALDSTLTRFIVNQSAVQALNLSDSIFDVPLTWDTEVIPQKGKVIGVVDDFHFKSLHKAVQPLIILAYPTASNYLLVKVQATRDPSLIIDKIKEVHKTFDPVFELDHYFLDELVDSQYHSDQQTLSVLQVFSGIALFLSALGLLGLAYLSITQKTREIGIRKVLGANVNQLMARENFSFVKVVVGSLVVALPIAYWVMIEWLNRFVYRTNDFWMPALITMAILTGITIACVSIAILRTTMQNPTKAIKYE